MKKGLVFFDIDGTLAYNSLPPTSKVCHAIENLQKNGYYAIVNTSMPRSMIYPEILMMNFDGIISSAGSTIEFNGERIFEEKISPNLLDKTVELAYEKSMTIFMASNDNIVQYKSKKNLDTSLLDLTLIEEMENFKDKCKVNKLTYIVNSWAEAEPLIPFFEENYHMIIHKKARYGELLPKGISKASAMLRLTQHLNMDMKQTYAIGDGMNDFDMLKAAGYSIAMGNAVNEITKIADFVTKSITEDGVAFALEYAGLI